MKRIRLGIALMILILPFFFGCPSAKNVTKSEDPPPDPLIVGVTPDYPPLIYKADGRVIGVEADFARLLATALNRRLMFHELRWDDLIPALMSGKIDIIMAGMTATEARKVRIDFTESYFKSGLVTAMRAQDLNTYNSLELIKQSAGSVGVIPGSVGDVYVQRNFPKARRIDIAKVDHATFELKTHQIDLFVADGPAVVWLVSRNEADLAGFWEPLAVEPLAWGVNRPNVELMSAVNRTLEQWKQDGTLKRVLMRWLPYLDRLE